MVTAALALLMFIGLLGVAWMFIAAAVAVDLQRAMDAAQEEACAEEDEHGTA